LIAARALHGGASDCRNCTLHQLFLLTNLGERAGSGVPKIRSGWEAAGHSLRLFDSFEPFDQAVLEMGWAPAGGGTTEASEQTSEEASVETSGRILALLSAAPTLTAKQMASQLDLTPRAVEMQLAKLKAENRLQRIGPNKGGHWEVLK